MTYCYTPIDRPDFFGENSDCLTINHDLKVRNGGLSEGPQSEISAILIQLNTDSRALEQRGWWGDQFQPFPIGNNLWSFSGNRNAPGMVARVDEAIRASLQPIIAQGFIDSIATNVVRTINGIEATVDAKKNDKSVFTGTI